MMVKICGITRREDAEAAVKAGAAALGFVFYPPSPRFVTPQRAEELGRGLDVWKVGVFVNQTTAEIEAIVRAAKLDVAQIYGPAAPSALRFWRAIRVGASPPRRPESGPEAVLLDGLGNGQSFDWALARGAAAKVIVAGGLDASNVVQAIRSAQPWGVDASSRLESSPGVKDHEKMKRFLETALNV
ncbi:MAG TPA: phosphoribosylanthranilate isomerase [Bryobacteraceae bacterium]|nr:phosphoribosylanthranilate isomerase [Bryobacteraceae bacterium]